MENTATTNINDVNTDSVGTTQGGLSASTPQQQESLPTEKLLAALYWIWDAFDRANVPMFLVHDTAKEAMKGHDLKGDRVEIGVRLMEWNSGGRRILDNFLGKPEEDEPPKEVGAFGITKYIYNSVPVYIYSYPDDNCIIALDPKMYRNESFKFPNPYARFEELYG